MQLKQLKKKNTRVKFFKNDYYNLCAVLKMNFSKRPRLFLQLTPVLFNIIGSLPQSSKKIETMARG